MVANIYLFLFGLITGSFYNVCIYRLPKGQNIVSKPSACRKCKKKIKWYENIPIISYLALQGKCSQCKKIISPQYPLVELITGLIFLYSYSLYGLSLHFAALTILLSSLLIIFFTDLNEYLILDVITLPMTCVGLLITVINQNPFNLTIIDSVSGAVIGYLVLYSIRWYYLKLRKIEGMGLGDAKLLLMLGAWLGIKSILFILIVSSISALIISIPIVIIKKNSKYPIPYGCFIVFAAFLYTLLGDSFYKFIL